MMTIFWKISTTLILTATGLFAMQRTGKPVTKTPGDTKGFAVIELFTSESCSSCPSAEKAVGEYVDKPNVFVLEFHVDYWNHLSWKDKYSSPKYTNRQRYYAAVFNLNSVYTPQSVINGKYEIVGSDRLKLSSLIKTESAHTPGPMPDLDIKVSGNTVKVITDERIPGAVLNIAIVQRNAETAVKRGENAGVTIRHHNVVRAFETMALNGNAAVSIKIPEGLSKEDCRLIGYVQEMSTGKILSASVFNVP